MDHFLQLKTALRQMAEIMLNWAMGQLYHIYNQEI